VPLEIAERGSDLVRTWLREDPVIATWGLTRLEIASAIERRTREGVIGTVQRREIVARFNALADSWGEVTDLLAVRTRAALLLVRHPIRAADAAQLAAAMLVAEGNPGTIEFACLDRELAVAAEREGFRVRTWPGA
jgi:predicted nucleic acid-binding protein